MNYTDLFSEMQNDEDLFGEMQNDEESPPNEEEKDYIEASTITHTNPENLTYSYSDLEMDYQNGFSPLPIPKETDFVCMTEVRPSETSQRQLENIINGVYESVHILNEVLDNQNEESKGEDGENTAEIEIFENKKAREYKNQVTYEKYNYAKPKDIDGNPLQKLIFFLIMAVVVGIFLGLQGSSYFNFKGGKVDGAFSCLYLWLMESSMPFRPFPLNSSIFTTGFFTGTIGMGLIGLFTYLDNEYQKAVKSRSRTRSGSARNKERFQKASDTIYGQWRL